MRIGPARITGSCAALLCLLAAGCATIPKGKFGVSAVKVKGVKQMDEHALLVCLATHERSWFGFELGGEPPTECGAPPFDVKRLRVDLWPWPWTDWPVYSKALLARDLERVERWYRARGFYDAEVTNLRLTKQAKARRLQIYITVSEGEPVRIAKINLTGIDKLPPEAQKQARNAIGLHTGDRFDEAEYDLSKKSLVQALAESSYAKAVVNGKVLVDPDARRAEITFIAAPGLAASAKCASRVIAHYRPTPSSAPRS